MSPVRWTWWLMRLNYYAQALPRSAPLQGAPPLPRDETSVRRVVWPMVVTRWSYGVRQPSGSRCVVVSGHCLRAQPGLRVNLATMVYLLWMAVQFTGSPSCCWPTSSILYALAVLVLLFSRTSRLSGIVSAGVAYSVRLPRQVFFPSRCCDLITACSLPYRA